ncbi:MAG TPA: hypothetical protein PKE59_00395 [Novosphingobium sp.]|jgi:hypothetical protein|nr:hypothetical protein [Novosphingobium sp.]
MVRHYKDVMPVRVRGVDFPNARACADHFGIRPQTVYNAVAAGRADMIGLGPGRHNGPRRGGRQETFKIGPLTFESQTKASRALGFSRSYICQALAGRSGFSMDVVVGRAMEVAARAESSGKEAV